MVEHAFSLVQCELNCWTYVKPSKERKNVGKEKKASGTEKEVT
jgi:hypothetical protein